MVTRITDLAPQPCVMNWNIVITSQRLGFQTPEHTHRSFYTTPASSHCGSYYRCVYWITLWVTLVSADYLYICRD